MTSKEIKIALHQRCDFILTQKVELIKSRLASIQESKNKETKSSAGDKFETGRAMMQIEEDKCNAQLATILTSFAALKEVDLDVKRDTVSNGSLVITDRANYFISIGVGKIELDGTIYYCLSKEAPIGRLFLGKVEGDSITFNNNKITIKSIL